MQVGSDPNASPRYYYLYNGHGDVVALVNAQATVAASYSYDAFGQLTSASSENFGGTTTWTNPYRYDGEIGLNWMSVRAYDPALGRLPYGAERSTHAKGARDALRIPAESSEIERLRPACIRRQCLASMPEG